MYYFGFLFMFGRFDVGRIAGFKIVKSLGTIYDVGEVFSKYFRLIYISG